MKGFLIIASLILWSHNASSQIIEPKFTINAGLGLPSTISNEAYDSKIQGLVNGYFIGQYSFPFHFHVGAGISYSLNVINEFAFTTPISGQFHNAMGFLNIGYDQFYTDKFGVDVSLRLGHSYNFVQSNLLKDTGESTRSFDASYIEGVLGFFLAADEKSSFRLSLGYGGQGYTFDQTMVGMPNKGVYTESESNKFTQFFTLTFGYTYYISSAKN